MDWALFPVKSRQSMAVSSCEAKGLTILVDAARVPASQPPFRITAQLSGYPAAPDRFISSA